MKERNSNLEMLRIIAMLLIVIAHYSSHGLFGQGAILEYSFDRYVAELSLVGKYGNIIFVLISGYYMCDSRITVHKLVRLWGEVAFYSILFWGIFFIIRIAGGEPLLQSLMLHVGKRELFEAILPIGNSSYWFVTDYIILMLVSPLLNMALHSLSKRQLQILLIVATIFWSIIPTFTSAKYAETELLWWFILYIYAGYIRLYADLEKSNRSYRVNLVIALAAFLICAVFACVMTYRWNVTGIERYITEGRTIRAINSPLVLLFGVEMLIGFAKIPPHYNKTVNVIGASTFGVYLIHNNDLVKPFLWKYLLGLPESVYKTGYLIPHMIVSVLVVYTVCVIIDIIRRRTVERWYLESIHRLKSQGNSRYIYIEKISERCIGIMERILH